MENNSKERLESLTSLLKAHEVELSAVTANKKLIALGFMVERERPSSTKPGVMKKYKELVGRGLEFGINQENPNSPEQTSPYYYNSKFTELAVLLLAKDPQ